MKKITGENDQDSYVLIQAGRVVAVHDDDPIGGLYYTVEIDQNEVQVNESNLKRPGMWEAKFIVEGTLLMYSYRRLPSMV